MDLNQIMGSPYKRIIAMHLAIIFGGILIQSTGVSVWGLVVLIGVKIFIDIASHIKSHEKINKDFPSKEVRANI